MSKQLDAVRRMLAIGRPLQCDDDDDVVECVSVSRDGDDNQPGDGSGFPIDSYRAG